MKVLVAITEPERESALVGDSDVADARMGARDELPRIARMTFGGVLRVAPSEVVGPRDHLPGPFAREPDQRLREREVFVHGEHVVRDHAIGFRENRAQPAHQFLDKSVVRLSPLAARK